MSNHQFSLGKVVRQTARYVRFVAASFPAFHGLLLLSVLVLALEYLATSLMIPLVSATSSQGLAMRFWTAVASWIGFEPSMRIWMWLFLLLMSFRLTLGFLQTFATNMLGKRVHRLLSERVFKHVIAEESLATIYSRSIGHYITLAGDDTFRCGTIISSLLQGLVGFLTAALSMIVMFQFSPTYFWGLTVFLGFSGLIIALMMRRMVRLTVASNLLSRELNTAFIESINALRSIRALAAERIVTVSYADQITRYVYQLLQIESLKVGMRSLPAIVLLLIAAWFTRPGAEIGVSEASFFGATVIVIRLFAALGQMVAAGMLVVTDLRALHDIDVLIGLASDNVSSAAKLGTAMHGPIRKLELHGIDFRYPGGEMLFHGADFRFEAGRTYAVIGPSGTGKSTLADLILGLVAPQAGELRLNGECCAVGSLQQKVLLVEQQPRIFSTTVRDNLLFGIQASDEALWDALAIVDMAQTVRALPQGLDTLLSYQGENFSGGQRQRIGVARAMLRHPEVLILDEATSALDTDTREVLLANVKHRMKDGILIFITHDPSIVARADVVVDLTQSEVHDTSAPVVVETNSPVVLHVGT